MGRGCVSTGRRDVISSHLIRCQAARTETRALSATALPAGTMRRAGSHSRLQMTGFAQATRTEPSKRAGLGKRASARSRTTSRIPWPRDVAASLRLVLFGLPLLHFLSQFVCYPSDSVNQFPYPQCHFGKSMFPMFPVATLLTNILHRESQGSNGFRHRFRHVRALHFEILHYFFVEGLTSAAASGIGVCAATLLLPASD